MQPRVFGSALPQGTAKRLGGILEGVVTDRFKALVEQPRLEQALAGRTSVQDPLMTKLSNAMRGRKQLIRKRRRKKEGATVLSGADIEQLKKSAMKGGKSRLHDAQLRRAVDKHRVNSWMFSEDLEVLLRTQVGMSVKKAALEVGMPSPVVFCDRAIFRLPFSQPRGYNCGYVGCGVMPHTPVLVASIPCLDDGIEMHYLAGSEKVVEEELRGRIQNGDVSTDFLPSESHIPHVLGENPTLQSLPRQSFGVNVGDMLLCDGGSLVADNANFTPLTRCVYQLVLVDRHAMPSLKPESWIKSWKSRVPRSLFRDANHFITL